jgi:hypothetical protein
MEKKNKNHKDKEGEQKLKCNGDGAKNREEGTENGSFAAYLALSRVISRCVSWKRCRGKIMVTYQSLMGRD